MHASVRLGVPLAVGAPGAKDPPKKDQSVGGEWVVDKGAAGGDGRAAPRAASRSSSRPPDRRPSGNSPGNPTRPTTNWTPRQIRGRST
jgi:hypothetical protein